MKRSHFIAPRLGGLAEKLALRIRTQIYHKTIKYIKFTPESQVLDLGVTSDNSLDSNFFESLYPYPEKITAVGLEDASFLQKTYPGLQFIRSDILEMPFVDDGYKFSFCSAVIEHVGSRDQQAKLIKEALRVSECLILTTPNRWYPVEFHTLTPFIHWFHPRIFRFYLKITGRKFFAEEQNLNLLTEAELLKIIQDLGFSCKKCHVKLFGMISNLVFVIEKLDI